MKLILVSFLICLASCKSLTKNKNSVVDNMAVANIVSFDLEREINNCEAQLNKSVPKLTDLPRLIETNATEWKEIPNGRLVWTSGFYPGILWYMYDLTRTINGKRKP